MKLAKIALLVTDENMGLCLYMPAEVEFKLPPYIFGHMVFNLFGRLVNQRA